MHGQGCHGLSSVLLRSVKTHIVVRHGFYDKCPSYYRLGDKSCLDSLELLPRLLEWIPKLSDQMVQSHTSQRHLKIGIASQKSQNEHRD